MQEFGLENVNKLLGINESFKAPDRIMELIFNKEKREELFNEFLKISTDMSFDWFHKYFEEEQAQRKTDKQDFTPQSVANLLSSLASQGKTYFEPAAGTGGITITRWWEDCLKESPFKYMPHEHFYYCEEMSDRAIPFLLFNLAIRGMNAIVWHGDSLERCCRGIFFIENSNDNAMGFSDINVMPYNEEVKNEFNVQEWAGEKYSEHVETETELWWKNVQANMALKKEWGTKIARNN